MTPLSALNQPNNDIAIIHGKSMVTPMPREGTI